MPLIRQANLNPAIFVPEVWLKLFSWGLENRNLATPEKWKPSNTHYPISANKYPSANDWTKATTAYTTKTECGQETTWASVHAIFPGPRPYPGPWPPIRKNNHPSWNPRHLSTRNRMSPKWDSNIFKHAFAERSQILEENMKLPKRMQLRVWLTSKLWVNNQVSQLKPWPSTVVGTRGTTAPLTLETNALTKFKV